MPRRPTSARRPRRPAARRPKPQPIGLPHPPRGPTTNVRAHVVRPKSGRPHVRRQHQRKLGFWERLRSKRKTTPKTPKDVIAERRREQADREIHRKRMEEQGKIDQEEYGDRRAQAEARGGEASERRENRAERKLQKETTRKQRLALEEQTRMEKRKETETTTKRHIGQIESEREEARLHSEALVEGRQSTFLSRKENRDIKKLRDLEKRSEERVKEGKGTEADKDWEHQRKYEEERKRADDERRRDEETRKHEEEAKRQGRLMQAEQAGREQYEREHAPPPPPPQ